MYRSSHASANTLPDDIRHIPGEDRTPLASAPRRVLCVAPDTGRLKRAAKLVRDTFPGTTIFSATSRDEAADLVPRRRPCWLLVDSALESSSDLDLLAGLAVHTPVPRGLVITRNYNPTHLLAALQAGARGYLLDTVDSDEVLRQQLRAVARGSLYIPAPLSGCLLRVLQCSPMAGDYTQKPPRLSRQERVVLRYLTQGFSARQISTRIGVQVSTVQTYIRRLYRKLDVTTRAEATARALKMCLPVEPD